MKIVPPQWKRPSLYSATIYGQLWGVDRSPPTIRKKSSRFLRSFSSRMRSFGTLNGVFLTTPHLISGHFARTKTLFWLPGLPGHASENRICSDKTCESWEIFEMNGPGTTPTVCCSWGSLEWNFQLNTFDKRIFGSNYRTFCMKKRGKLLELIIYSGSSSISDSQASFAQSIGWSHTGNHRPRKFLYKMPSVCGTINVCDN